MPLAARRAVISSRPNPGADPGPRLGQEQQALPAKDGLSFPREARLVRKSEYDAVYRNGKRRSSSHFTLFVRPNDLPLSRFGFSIKKALGGAVVRNRIRRRLREMVRCHRQEIPAGWDFVMHPKSSVAKAPMPVLTAELLRLVKNL